MAIEVILAFDHPIACEDGACEYVFPTVVGPRFIPATQIDPGDINPDVVPPGQSTGQRLTMSIDLDAGVSLHDLRSPSHRATIARIGDSRARVTLAGAESAVLNRDVRLQWRVGADAPDFGLLSWRDAGGEDPHGVFSLILQPPAGDSDYLRDEDAPARELVFVLDCSGSMSGVPIEAAKGVVRKALAAVRPQDTFQIIRFSENASGLGARPLTPTPQNITRALTHLESLRGSGGTRMIEGIRAALATPADPNRLRIVAFLTDGYIGNETEILAEVQRLLGDTRLFSFGIGSSVNRYLLEGLAEEGRGEAAFLGPRESPDAMVERFVKRIATPVLTDIRVIWEDLEVTDLEPATIPDLFAGQPLVLHGRYTKPGTGLLTVEGRRGGLPVTLRQVVTLHETATDHEALARLWARARIHRLSREMHGGERHDVKEAITSLGLQFRLMTAYTSLVAVDSIVSNTTGSSTRVDVPVELPEDVSYEGIFGRGDVAKSKLAQAPGRASMRALGYIGSNSTGGFVSADAAEGRAGGPPPPARKPGREEVALNEPFEQDGKKEVRFTRLILVEADSTRLVVEPDGEVWSIAGRSRSLLRTLTASALQELRRALKATHPGTWSGSGAGAHLRVETAGDAWTVDLPSSDRTILQLVGLIRGSAS
jgi:Ca-activated chloride channel family protein